MHTFAEELPLAAVLSRQFQDLYCAACFEELKKDESIITCDDCVEVSYCSPKCQRKDWRNVHEFECEVLRTQKVPMTSVMRLCIRILILKGKSTESTSSNGARLEDLETNYNEFRSSPAHNEFLTDVLTIISTSAPGIFGGRDDIRSTIGVICAVLCNSFGIIDEKRVEPIGSGLYVGMAKMNHSCAASAHVVFEKSRVILRTSSSSSQDFSMTKPLKISYVSRMLPTSLRQKSIRNVHFITCKCEMCRDVETDDVGLSSRCRDPECVTGYVVKSKCQVCGKTEKFSYEEAAHSTAKLIDILENFHKDSDENGEFKRLQKLREEYSEILSDCNVAILQLDEQIAYSASKLNQTELPSDEVLEQIAMRGVHEFATRLSYGSPEVTRRMYIGCNCLERRRNSKNNVEIVNFMKKSVESSYLSHGKEHTISKQLTKFLEENLNI